MQEIKNFESKIVKINIRGQVTKKSKNLGRNRAKK